MDHFTRCQSCYLPFDEEHEQYRTDNPLYCSYCMQDGQFINPKLTMNEAIEIALPHLSQKMGKEAARKELERIFPSLARWKKD